MEKGKPIEQLKGWAKSTPQWDAMAGLVDLLETEGKDTRAFLIQRGKAASALGRAAQAFEQARGKAQGWELGAIGYGKLLAYYGLGLVDENDFRKWRKFFGY